MVVDLFSEKVWFADLVAERLPRATHLAFHPLFGPDVEWAGQNMIVSPDDVDDPRARALLDLFKDWGVSVLGVSPEEHDRLMGVVQVGVHAALVVTPGSWFRRESTLSCWILSPRRRRG